MIIHGNALEKLRGMDPECIDMCLTSPPYWGLRDYGHEDQLGLEPTPELYIEHMTAVFHEVKRVLKKEGTLWIVIGDTYGGRCQGGGDTGLSKERDRKELLTYADKPQKKMMPKCLMMIPERLCWSLIQDGWILRNKIIWYKPNAMPSSVKDRFSNKYEFIYMFSQQQKYYFDLDAVREAHQTTGESRRLVDGNPSQSRYSEASDYGVSTGTRMGQSELGKNPGDVFEIPSETRQMGAIIGDSGAVKVPGGKGWTGHPEGGGAACQKDPRWCPPDGKNPGDFWEIPTQPFPEAHFAVFPEKLCEKPIKAGCPEEVCRKCGKGRERKIELGNISSTGGIRKERQSLERHNYENPKMIAREHKTVGWTSCDCNAGFEGGIVIDPFCGAGTVGVVAKELGRNFIGIDIKKEYCEMAEKRIAKSAYQIELA